MRLASGKRVHTFAKAAKLCATLGVTAAAGCVARPTLRDLFGPDCFGCAPCISLSCKLSSQADVGHSPLPPACHQRPSLCGPPLLRHPLCPPLGIPLSKPAHRPAIPRGHQDHEHLCNSSDTPASLPLLAPRSHNVLYIAMLGMAAFSLIGAVRPGGNDSGRCRVGQHFKW